MSTRQLNEWKGEFGRQYIERNRLEDWKVPFGVKAFSRILGTITPGAILEVGSNIGLNLFFLRIVLGKDVRLFAIEPNPDAVKELKVNDEISAACVQGSGLEIPFKDSSFELVFTCGVLIHVAPQHLLEITREIVRVSSRYVLCLEYFSHRPEEVVYHGKNGLLFKRDFGKFYLENFSELVPINYGFLWQEELPIFDNINWWLFEKAGKSC